MGSSRLYLRSISEDEEYIAVHKANKLIGVAVGEVNDLAAGDTKTFSALTTDDLSAAATYKVYISAMVQ